jgi:hypothetical protein
LSLMRSTAEAFDSRDAIVSLLVNNAVRYMRFRSVRRTLTHCAWDEAQLAALKESLSAGEDIAARWREVLWNERAMALVMLNDATSVENYIDTFDEDYAIAGLPSDQQLLIEYFGDMLAASGDSMIQWERRAEALVRRLQASHPNSVVGMLLPATSQVIVSGIKVEENRRWTLAAVALRQNHQQRGSWPKQLSDLETLGLVFDDYSNMRSEMFGYEVDGETAYLWMRDETGSREGRIISTRPIEQKEGESLDSYLLELR